MAQTLRTYEDSGFEKSYQVSILLSGSGDMLGEMCQCIYWTEDRCQWALEEDIVRIVAP